MQEQAGVSVSSGRLRLMVGAVIAVALLGALIWLIFFRVALPKPSGSHSTATKQHQPADGQPDGSSEQPGATPDAGPSQLVNAGAGNVLVLMAVASGAGGVLYQGKLRKKLSR